MIINKHIQGELTFATVGAYLAEGDVVVSAKQPFEIDLSAVQRIDTAGVALLLSWMRQCQRCDAPFVLSGVSPQVRSLLEVFELEALLLS